ncbi:MAG: hypothetical protein SGILL_001601 [Bacillariaceae sp.]
MHPDFLEKIILSRKREHWEWEKVLQKIKCRASVLVVLVAANKLAFAETSIKIDDDDRPSKPPLECGLYIAQSTIPNAGLGIFTGISKSEGDTIGNGDKAIPLVDFYWHNGEYTDESHLDDEHHQPFFNPLSDYVWHGIGMGMDYETEIDEDITAFWPGIDAMINCNLGLLNVVKSTPEYDEAGLHRNSHPGAGSISAYDAAPTKIIRDIPVGGELFKHYGDFWFTSRDFAFGNIPISTDYIDILNVTWALKNLTDSVPSFQKLSPSTLYKELVLEAKEIWDSRTLNALHTATWEDILEATEAFDIGVLLQPNATRSIEWLDAHGGCIDHIVPEYSTIDGAGHGAFAKRDLPKGTIVTVTPAVHFPDRKVMNMYFEKDAEDGQQVRDMESGPSGHQLLMNYCFGHPQSTLLVCPYGAGVNYINHNQTKANVKVHWAPHGSFNHDSKWLETYPKDMMWESSTKLAMEYVALRDIQEGEELFLDYGNEWETAWQKHVEEWAGAMTEPEEYVSAHQMNLINGESPIRTKQEQDVEPYPANLGINCHYALRQSIWEELVETSWEGTHGGPLDYIDEIGWLRDYKGFPCVILNRDDTNDMYSVALQFTEDGEDFEELVQEVPRQAIMFVDVPYTTDIHLIGAFRHAIGIPDEIMPEAWKHEQP